MTTSLAFLKPGIENKIELNDVSGETTFDQIAEILFTKLGELQQAPEKPDQIRLIYFGKKLDPKDKVSTIINPDIEPPYTMQIYIEKNSSKIATTDSQEESSTKSDGGCCYLI